MSAGALATMLILLGPSPQALDQDLVSAWLLATYPRESARVEQVYTRLALKMREEDLMRRQIREPRMLFYVGAGDRCRVDTIDVATGQFRSTYLATPEENLIVRRGKSRKSYVVSEVQTVSDECMKEQLRIGVPLAFSPWCWGEHRISDLLASDGVRIRDVSFGSHPQYGRVCDVKWEFTDADLYSRFGRFRFAMDHSWVLLACEFQIEEFYRLGGEFAYGDDVVDGIPIMQTAEFWFEQDGQRKPMRKVTLESFTTEDPSPELFDPYVYKVAAQLTAAVGSRRDWMASITPVLIGSVLVGICVPWSVRRFGGARQEHETVSSTRRSAQRDGQLNVTVSST